jgi:hypothetical protein
MNKKEAIILINSKNNDKRLNNNNTHWSNIVKYGNDFGWWLNIPFHKFKDGFFIILNDTIYESLIFLKLPGNEIQNPESKFRIKENTSDIYISYGDKKTLTDSQSNSTNFQFASFIIAEYPWK